MKRARSRGIAIIMVIVILAGLAALVVPFALSNIMHRRETASDLAAAQAQAAAEGALTHALAHLYRTALKAKGYDPTPEVDTLDELRVSMDFPGASADVETPRDILWSATIEDEQGKINLLSTPPGLMGSLLGATTLTDAVGRDAAVLPVFDPGVFPCDADPASADGMVGIGGDVIPYTNAVGTQIFLAPQPPDYCIRRKHRINDLVYDGRAVWICDYKFRPGSNVFRPFRSIYEIKAISNANRVLAIRPDEFAKIERFITVHSGRDGPGWGHAERLVGQVITSSQRGFTVENDNGFGRGAIVRFSQAGKTLTYGRLAAVQVNAALRRTTLVLEEDVGLSADGTGVGQDLFVEPELRHPININTAPAEVLYACVVGLGFTRDHEVVDSPHAWLLAQFLRTRKYANADDLGQALNDARAQGLLISGLVRDAVYTNATEPNSPKLRSPTVPFCYRSYGSYTLEGSAAVNTPNGAPLARSMLRQIVTLPTPSPGQFLLKTQEQFQKLVDEGLTQHVVTWPVALPNRAKYRTDVVTKHPDTHTGKVRLDGGEVGSHGRYCPEVIEHCDNPNDASFFQEGYEFGRHGPFQYAGVAGPNNFAPPTGVEFWYRGSGTGYLFDQGEEEERNRASFYYEQGKGLTIRIYDANLERKSCEYNFPFKMEKDEWYHLAGSWRSSLPGGQEVRVDAEPLPRDGEVTFKPATKLTADLTLDETDALEVEDPDGAGLAEQGVVRVGEEIIEYFKRSGKKLQLLRRGARMSTQAPHQSDEVVLSYGYACPLGQDLPIGRGLLAERMEPRAQTSVWYPMPPNKRDFILHDETSKIPVVDASDFPPCGFVIISGEVIYYDKKTPRSLEKLQRGLSIAGISGKPRNLRHGSGVSLVSFQVDRFDDYDRSGHLQIDSEGDDKVVEWISYGDKQSMNGKNFFLPRVSQSVPHSIQQGDPPKTLPNEFSVGVSEWRAWMFTQALPHAKKAKVIPVISMTGPQIGDTASPVGENISTVSVITRGQAGGDVRWIKRAVTHQYAVTRWDALHRVEVFVDWGFEYWAGLNDFVSRRYPGQGSRYMRFPSGELPDAYPGRTVGAARDGAGQLTGQVDEIKVVALPSLGGKIAWDYQKGLNVGLPNGETEVLVETPDAWPRPNGGGFLPGWPATGGIIRSGDELMSYDSASNYSLNYYADVYPTLKLKQDRRWKNELHPNNNNENRAVLRLSGLKRGLLNTPQVDHPPGEGVMLYDAAPFTTLASGLAPRADIFNVRDAKGFAAEGFAWVGNEVVSWLEHKVNTNGFSGCQVFHGRYGTPTGDHQSGELVRGLPFRYWDRCVKEYDGAGLAYIQAGHTVTDGVWEGVDLNIGPGPNQALPVNCQPRILARFNGMPNWDERPTNREGGIFLFTGPGLHNFGTSKKLGLKADQIEVRIYWEYQNGAFAPQADWKRTWGLTELRLLYHSPFLVRRVEEVERR